MAYRRLLHRDSIVLAGTLVEMTPPGCNQMDIPPSDIALVRTYSAVCKRSFHRSP